MKKLITGLLSLCMCFGIGALLSSCGYASAAATTKGTTWYSGTGSPNNNNTSGAQAGDYYLDGNGNVWKLETNGWVKTDVNIKGDQGEDGTNGTNGTQGAKGEAGKDGKDGTQFYSGDYVPTASKPANTQAGDLYFNTKTSDLYQRANNNTWTKITNLKGAQGEQGIEGKGVTKIEYNSQGLVITYTDGKTVTVPLETCNHNIDNNNEVTFTQVQKHSCNPSTNEVTDGIYTYTCSDCGYLGIWEGTIHNYKPETVQATCIKDGYTIDVCSECGYKNETSKIDHLLEDERTNKDGNHVLTATTTGPMKVNKDYKPASCLEEDLNGDGYADGNAIWLYYCESCKNEIEVVQDNTKSQHKSDEIKITTDELEDYNVCEEGEIWAPCCTNKVKRYNTETGKFETEIVCPDVNYDDQYTKTPHGHVVDIWSVDTKPSITTEGTLSGQCNTCHKNLTITLPVFNFNDYYYEACSPDEEIECTFTMYILKDGFFQNSDKANYLSKTDKDITGEDKWQKVEITVVTTVPHSSSNEFMTETHYLVPREDIIQLDRQYASSCVESGYGAGYYVCEHCGESVYITTYLDHVFAAPTTQPVCYMDQEETVYCTVEGCNASKVATIEQVDHTHTYIFEITTRDDFPSGDYVTDATLLENISKYFTATLHIDCEDCDYEEDVTLTPTEVKGLVNYACDCTNCKQNTTCNNTCDCTSNVNDCACKVQKCEEGYLKYEYMVDNEVVAEYTETIEIIHVLDENKAPSCEVEEDGYHYHKQVCEICGKVLVIKKVEADDCDIHNNNNN